jgi:hypothetical protein
MNAIKKSRKWARWCWSFLAGCLLLMGSTAAITLLVDPYQIYHPVLGGHPRYNRYLQRFFVPGLARTANYAVAIAGTSMLQNIPNSAVQRVCGGRAVNLCIAGASIYEEALTLRLALQHEGTKTVILTMDYNSFSGGGSEPILGMNLVFPAYLYDHSIFNKFPYLLSFDALLTSYRLLYAPVTSAETLDADWPWKFPDTMKFQASSAVNGIDPSAINRNLRMTNLDLESMRSAFADNMFPILAGNKNAKIHFVFPPYSILVWHDYAQRSQIPTYFAFKKWLVEQSQRFDNFDVVDYQDRAEIITNLSLYADIYHFNERIAEQVVRSACAGDAVLTRDNVDARNQSLLRLVQSTDPAEIVKKALSSYQ